MRMVVMHAPPNHGPTVTIGNSELSIVDGKVEVFDIYEDTLKAHGYVSVGGSEIPVSIAKVEQAAAPASVSIPVSTLHKVLEDLGVYSAKDLPNDRLVGALVEAAGRQAERFAHEMVLAKAEGVKEAAAVASSIVPPPKVKAKRDKGGRFRLPVE